MKVDSDGNPISARRSAPAADAGGRVGRDRGEKSWTAEQLVVAELDRTLRTFIGRDDGYLKVKRELGGDDIHYTWIWTLGKWAQHYVYVRGPYWQLVDMLQLLEGKVDEVDEGRRRPTPDRFNR